MQSHSTCSHTHTAHAVTHTQHMQSHSTCSHTHAHTCTHSHTHKLTPIATVSINISLALSGLNTFFIVLGVGVRRVSINTFLLEIGVRGKLEELWDTGDGVGVVGGIGVWLVSVVSSSSLASSLSCLPNVI